jgi:hypothetical protein
MKPLPRLLTLTLVIATHSTAIEYNAKDDTDQSKASSCTSKQKGDIVKLECITEKRVSNNVTINVTGTPANCTNFPPILNGAVDTSILANNSPEPGVYDGTYAGFQNNGGATGDWPGVYGDSISLSLSKDQYIAASFTTNSIHENGKFQLATPGNTQGPSSTGTISISTCPGDYTSHLDQASCLKSVGPSGSFRWSTDPSASSIYCKLESNTAYYFNIVHSISAATNYSVSSCGSSYCGILATQVSD